LLDLSGALGVPAAELERARTGGRSILDLMWQHLEEASGPWVLVMDNADSPAPDQASTAEFAGFAWGRA
jgi:hypothetical protein